MKVFKAGIITFVFIFFTFYPSLIFAARQSTITPSQIRERIKTKIQEATYGALQRIKFKKAVILGGKVTAKEESLIKIKTDEKEITVKVDNRTQFRRRFWGISSFDEISIDDTVSVYGTWIDDNQTALQARLIRDYSIQKRFAVFVGEVKSITDEGFVMSTVSASRTDQTILLSNDTKIVNRKNQKMDKNEIAIGHRVRVKGLWNMASNTLSEVTQVKDYTLPPIVTPTKETIQ